MFGMSNYETSAERYLNTFLSMLPQNFYDMPKFLEQLNALGAAIVKTNHALHCRAKLHFGATRFAIIGGNFVIKIDKGIKEYYTKTYGNNQSEFTFFKKYHSVLPLCPCQMIYKNNHSYLIMPKCKKVGKLRLENYFDSDNFLDYNLSDVHKDNIGLLNKTPVIIDYAANKEER